MARTGRVRSGELALVVMSSSVGAAFAALASDANEEMVAEDDAAPKREP